jgi:hypothetical protein
MSMSHIFTQRISQQIKEKISTILNISPEKQRANYSLIEDADNIQLRSIDIHSIDLDSPIKDGNVSFVYASPYNEPVISNLVVNPTLLDLCLNFEKSLQKSNTEHCTLENIEFSPKKDTDFTTISFMACS